MALGFSLAQIWHLLLISKGRVNVSYMAMNILPNVLIIIITLLSSEYIYIGYVFSYFFSLIFMVIVSPAENGCSESHHTLNVKFSERLNFFQQDMLSQVFTSVSTIVVSQTLSNSSVAIFSIYQKLSSVCNIIVSVVNQSFLSQGLDFIAEKKYGSVYLLSKTAFLKSSVYIVAYFIIMACFWEYMERYIFDDIVLDIYPFSFLVICYLFCAYSNVSTYMLNSFKYAYYVKNANYFTFVIGIFSLIIFSMLFDVLGAVLATGIMLVIQSVITRYKFLKVFNV